MSYLLPHLRSGWNVDQAILNEEDRVVVIRFGHDVDPTCMQMAEVPHTVSEDVKTFAATYLPGSLVVLLVQAAIPVSMPLSAGMLGEKYHGVQVRARLSTTQSQGLGGTAYKKARP